MSLVVETAGGSVPVPRVLTPGQMALWVPEIHVSKPGGSGAEVPAGRHGGPGAGPRLTVVPGVTLSLQSYGRSPVAQSPGGPAPSLGGLGIPCNYGNINLGIKKSGRERLVLP